MSSDWFRMLLVVIVGAHGIGHVLFMPLIMEPLGLSASGRSWLLTPVVGDGIVRIAATAVAGVVLVGFIAASAGLLTRAPWWPTVAIASALASAALVLVMWGGLQESSAFFAFLFDGAVLVALLVAHWPSELITSA